MAEIDLARLVAALRECAGDSDEYDLDGEILDIPFDELGYDSLALMELAAKLKQEDGVALSEEEVIEMTTPRLALRIINATREGVR
ncbi:acyl carrier protein [Amycolatopsis anabasis]|uniref:acyl carrier protein n=1 Tax=Amycolatopsis anabasis TaxID=1840409 RepID=UPI00131D8B82|nr:acyl carrier protein [Amycolatopsis anabasis]